MWAPLSRRSRVTRRNRSSRVARPGLHFEPCESRHLLTAGAITGTVFIDATGGGISPEDAPQPGVTVELYADDGDGIFNPTDPLVGSDITDLNGDYGFFDLASGTYYVQEIVPPGFIRTGGPAFYTVAVSDSSYGPAATDIVIDSFDSPGVPDQFIINLTSPDPTLAKQVSPLAIGGERDLLADVAGAATPISAAIEMGAGSLNFTTATIPGTVGTLQYDGLDADIVGPPAGLINAQGLAVDLTNGGVNNLLRFDFLTVDGGNLTQLEFQVRLTSLGGGSATATAFVDQVAGPTSELVPFSSFAQMGGFSFGTVTSIEVVFNPAAVERIEFILDLITSTNETSMGGFDWANFQPSPEASCLSGFVYADVNDNGLIDPGELGIPGVTITLTGTDINGDPVLRNTVTAANGFYIFEDLLPGTYKLTETHPVMFIDGKDTIGTPGGVTTNDMFSDIMLPADFCGVQNNFGERGLVPGEISKWLLIIHDNPWVPAVQPPTIDPIDNQFVVRGNPLSVQTMATAFNGGSLIYSLGPNSPNNAAVSDTGLVTWPTGPNSPDEVQITVGVIDRYGQTASRTFTVFVIDQPKDLPTNVVGTPGNDVIEFFPGATPRLVINGAFVTVQPAASYEFSTGGGTDRLILHDTTGDDTFEAGSGQNRMSGPGYQVVANGFAKVEAIASQGVDRAILKDSAGDDRLEGSIDNLTLSGTGYSVAARSFESASITATGGFDTASVTGSAGDDTLTARPANVEWASASVTTTIVGFDRTRVTGGAGFDRAFVYDSAGDDTLSIYPDRAELQAGGVDTIAAGFDRVRAFASGGFDRAFLYDSAADDDLYLYSNRTELKGATFDNIVYGFDRLRAFASGGKDRAFLYDSTGDDDLYLYSDRIELKGANFDNIVYAFDRVRAFASGGFDRAFLYDSAGDDDLYLYSDRTELKGTNFDNIVYGFDRVRAFASAGLDRAFLYDSIGDDDVSLYPTRAEVIGAGFNNIVYNFDRVRAFASSGLDRAFFYDSAGDDVFKSSNGVTQMSGSNFDNYAYSFDRVRAFATTGNDRAELNDTALDEQLTADGDWASLTNSQTMLWIQGFDWAKAMASSGGVNTRQVAAVNFVLEQEGDWLDL